MSTPPPNSLRDEQQSALFVSPGPSSSGDTANDQDRVRSAHDEENTEDSAAFGPLPSEAELVMILKQRQDDNKVVHARPEFLEQLYNAARYFDAADKDLQESTQASNDASGVDLALEEEDDMMAGEDRPGLSNTIHCTVEMDQGMEAQVNYEPDSLGPEIDDRLLKARGGIDEDRQEADIDMLSAVSLPKPGVKLRDLDNDDAWMGVDHVHKAIRRPRTTSISRSKKRKFARSREAEERRTSRKKRAKRSHAGDMHYPQFMASGSLRNRTSQALSGRTKKRETRSLIAGRTYDRHAGHENTDVLKERGKTQDLPAQPKYDEGTKLRKDALRQLVARVVPEHQEAARVDRRLCEKEMSKIRRRLALNGGEWLLTGMKTSMPTYQVLGTAFMRGREEGPAPTGGILADQMGLGKTVMIIANIMDGTPRKPKERKKLPRTTLIVSKTDLISQWARELAKHCHSRAEGVPSGIGRVLSHVAGNKLQGTDAEIMRKVDKSDILLTTYSMITKSFRVEEAPAHIVDSELRAEWEREYFEQHKGFLHRVSFLRVVLDEAHHIKNHGSKISRACRALQSKHRWAATGTPVMNSNDEFLSYFLFLGVKDLAIFEPSGEQHPTPGGASRDENLLSMVEKYMIRRTHGSVLFGAKLLELPAAKFTTIVVQFTPVERLLYTLIRERYLLQIKSICIHGVTKEVYPQVLVLLLRLRMFCAHMLLCQEVIEDLMTREDYEQIRHFVEVSKHDAGQGEKILVHLAGKIQQAMVDAEWETNRTKPFEVYQGTIMDDTPMPDSDDDRLGSSHGCSIDFSTYVESLTSSPAWNSIVERSACNKCSKTTEHAQRAACFHIYCPTCVLQLQEDAQERGERYAKCVTCNADMTSVIECERARSSEHVNGHLSKKDKRSPWVKILADPIASAKSRAIKAQILAWLDEDPCVKVIIYTQFLDFLEILKRICTIEGWGFVMYSGKMSTKARDKAIQNFGEDPLLQIMLASLQCGSIGLNLTMASRVICVDPWFNNPVEQQAFCRVFRMGQNQETRMTRIVVGDSIDEALMSMKVKKESEISQVMDDAKLLHGMTEDEIKNLLNGGGSDAEKDDEDDKESEQGPNGSLT